MAVTSIFPFFPTLFSVLQMSKNNVNANFLYLDQSKILLFGKGLTLYQTIPWFYDP